MEVTPVFAKEDELNEESYGAVSVLSQSSKVLKEWSSIKWIFFFESRFLPFLTGFRRNHSTQNALLNMSEKWKHALDKAKRLVLYFWIHLKRLIHLITISNEINRLHVWGLRALLNDEISTFNDMLSKGNDTTIHVKNI